MLPPPALIPPSMVNAGNIEHYYFTKTDYLFLFCCSQNNITGKKIIVILSGYIIGQFLKTLNYEARVTRTPTFCLPTRGRLKFEHKEHTNFNIVFNNVFGITNAQ